jgi:hypothetical protein
MVNRISPEEWAVTQQRLIPGLSGVLKIKLTGLVFI